MLYHTTMSDILTPLFKLFMQHNYVHVLEVVVLDLVAGEIMFHHTHSQFAISWPLEFASCCLCHWKPVLLMSNSTFDGQSKVFESRS